MGEKLLGYFVSNRPSLEALSQVFTFRSLPTEIMRCESGVNRTASTSPWCPRRVACSSPIIAPHTRTDPSLSPVANNFPSGLKATAVTCLVCPRNAVVSFPLFVSKTCTKYSA